MGAEVITWILRCQQKIINSQYRISNKKQESEDKNGANALRHCTENHGENTENHGVLRNRFATTLRDYLKSNPELTKIKKEKITNIEFSISNIQ